MRYNVQKFRVESVVGDFSTRPVKDKSEHSSHQAKILGPTEFSDPLNDVNVLMSVKADS